MSVDPEIRDRVLAAVPLAPAAMNVKEIAKESGVTDTTVRTYLKMFTAHGWMRSVTISRTAVYSRVWADTFFKPRPLPSAIFFDNGEIAGPFCVHCGWHTAGHGGSRLRCPATVHPLLGGSNE